MAVQFKLDAFQGPLDLLLHLISKHKLNICDIEISLLLDQYLEYMNQLDEQDYESAGEFLEMAARLIYIKTVSLLPQPEEAEELKKDLEGQIIEYSICKKAAEMLKEQYVGNDVFVRNPVAVIVDKTYTRVHEPDVLYNAYMGISAKSRSSKPLRAEMFSPIVSKKIVSVTSKIIFVLKKLYKTGVYNMSGLYDGVTEKSEKVATFLAVLELTKSGRIYINDDNTEIRFIRKEKKKAQKATAEPEISDITGNEQSEKTECDIGVAEKNYVPEISEDDFSENTADKYVTDDAVEIVENIKAEAPEKPVVKVSTERVLNTHVISCPVQFSDKIEEDNIAEMEIADEFEFNDIIEENHETEQITRPEYGCEEIPEFSTLTDPPDNIFKPNYWNKRKYFWGKCLVGDDGRNNYWYYG